jgi:hypothetical protein
VSFHFGNISNRSITPYFAAFRVQLRCEAFKKGIASVKKYQAGKAEQNVAVTRKTDQTAQAK